MFLIGISQLNVPANLLPGIVKAIQSVVQSVSRPVQIMLNVNIIATTGIADLAHVNQELLGLNGVMLKLNQITN